MLRLFKSNDHCPALALIAIVGASLYHVLPNFDPNATRRQCGALVLNVMLPALNIEVIYTAPIGHHLWQVPIAMTCGVAVCVSAALLVVTAFPIDRRLKNSLILGSAFGNVTYLGMPLLRGLFPQSVIDVTTVAILCEITVTSLDLTTGTILAAASDQERACLGPRGGDTDTQVPAVVVGGDRRRDQGAGYSVAAIRAVGAAPPG